MTQSTLRPRSRGSILGKAVLGLLLLGLAISFMAACGSNDSDFFTPPPATIIRASEDVTPTSATPTQEAYPMVTEAPVAAFPSATIPPEGYPPVAPTPRESPTPFVYPTP